MNTLRVFVAGTPQPNPKLETTSGVTKAGKRYTRVFQRDKDGKKRAWMNSIAVAVNRVMKQVKRECIGNDYWVELTVSVYVPRPDSVKRKDRIKPNVKPDASNYYYAVENTMKELMYTDDSLVTDLHCTKRYAEDNDGKCGVLIEVEWGLNRE